jgi:GH25 family lysozyme M1 (1,4-beta-N-acetylmuramidase)
MYPLLRKLKKLTGCEYSSIYRGDDALALLHANGKHSQRELAEATPAERTAWGVLGTPNPPDRGTHILLGDGTVGRLHEKLPWWRCGIDINLKGSEAEQEAEAERIETAARRLGWDLYRPYSSGSERHHFNFRRRPSRWRAFFRHAFGGKGKSPKHALADAKPAPRPSRNKRAADRLGAAIDVSEAQGDVDWKKVAHKVDVAFCKATEGTTFTDSRFSGARLEAMQKAGLRTGVYHFARPDNNSAAAEAAHFVRTVEAAGGRFISYADWKAGKQGVIGVLDFETAPFSKEWAVNFARKFKAMTDVDPMLYGYGSSLNPVLGAVPHFAGIWFAAYVDDWKPYLEGHHDRVVFWQDRDDWHCAGVSGDVDHSRYIGRGGS